MIEDLASFTDTVLQRPVSRLQRWVLSTRALSYNAGVMLNVWVDKDPDKRRFVESLMELQRPEVANADELILREALICVADTTDTEKFRCTTGLEKWCDRVHLQLVGSSAFYLDGTLIYIPEGSPPKTIPKSMNAAVVTPVYQRRTVQLVTFWGPEDMPKIWSIPRKNSVLGLVKP